MKQSIYAIALFLGLCLSPDIQAQPQHPSDGYPVANDAHLVLLSSQFSFTEGPTSDRKGTIYFTDQPNNKIWKYTTKGKLRLFMDDAGRSNGLYIDKRGWLVACADENNELWRISPKGKVTKLIRNYQDTLFNGPNDVWVSAKGYIYFTDPYYQRDYWTRTKQDLSVQALYRLKDKQVVRLDADFNQPNGIVGSADEQFLYVADIGANKTYRYRITADGSLTDKTLFANQGSDGMTVDQDGNLYLSGNGITVYNAKGEKINHIPVPAKWTANLCFGGKNHDMLFITASEKIFMLKMQVKGVD